MTVALLTTRAVRAMLIACCAISTRAYAQSAARFDHWQSIDAVSKEIGGLPNAPTASPAQVTRLADQLLQRGQAYLDLYEFQREVVRDHALMLDSAAKAGGPSFTATSYFLARALQELGETKGATVAYRKAAVTSPARLRSSASEWLTSLNATGARRWQSDLADWRRGKAVKSTTCPAGQRQCALLLAIFTNDLTGIARLQAELSQRPVADFVETAKSREGDVTVEFYDPLTLYLLGVADFVVAANIGEGKKDVDAWRGFALLRAGRFKEAAAALRTAVAGGGARAEQLNPLLGEAEFRQDNKAAAEQLWSSASGVGLNVLADVKSALGIDAESITKQARAERQRGLDRFAGGASGGAYLARALLRCNQLADAEDVLAAVRPASQGSRLTSVAPSVLALAAHVEYRRGKLPNYRDRYSFARADLADIASAAPVVGGLLRQLQELTMVADGPAKSRSFDNELSDHSNDQLPEEDSDA